MKLTTKERELLEESIEHWNKDIIDNFTIHNKTICEFASTLWNDGSLICDFELYCPLCIKYMRHNIRGVCTRCPYFKFYKINCDYHNKFELNGKKGHWYAWRMNKTLESAIAMRNALQRIVDSNK